MPEKIGPNAEIALERYGAPDQLDLFVGRGPGGKLPKQKGAALVRERPQVAPEVGIEPTTGRLTVACSTAELLRNRNRRGGGTTREGAVLTDRSRPRKGVVP